MTTAHLDIRHAPWMDNARCTEVDPELFFGEDGLYSADAKRVCQSCPVIADCYRYAQELKPQFGIFAGMSVRQLAQARKRERETA